MALGVCSSIAWVFPKAWNLVVDADSLAMIDFARDIVLGKSIQAWNLPRAPYLFPDAVIALLVMAFGWFNFETFLTIATINFCLCVAISHRILHRSKLVPSMPIWSIALLITLALYFIGAVFPFSMDNLYWQMFASGAHFLTAIVVVLIFDLARPDTSNKAVKPSLKTVALLIVLVFAEAISDSMSALLILSWYGATLFSSQYQGLKRLGQYLYIPITVCIGTGLSFFIPRQPLVDSFFSFEKFTLAMSLFFQWMQSSYIHNLFILVLILGSLSLPFLIRDVFPRTFKDLLQGVFSNYTLPALSVIIATPLLYQGTASLRYLAFPGLLTLWSLSLIGIKLFRKTLSSRHGCLAILLGALLLIIGISLLIIDARKIDHQSTKKLDLSTVIGTIPSADNPALAVQCMNQAAKRYALNDGIATYWNARPAYFSSQFQYYLAPVSPWQPRSGYMYWGNNGLDFVYQDGQRDRPRRYNFILAGNDELSLNLWGSLVAQSLDQVHCERHTVFIFSSPDVLQAYLFPFGKPFDIDQGGNFVRPSNKDQQWIAAPYWGSDLSTLVGLHDGLSIRATGQGGVLVYGPFIALPQGNYRLVATGHLEGVGKELGMIDVISNQGRSTLSSTPILKTQANSDQIGGLVFKLEHPVNDAEFRIFINPNTKGFFSKYQLTKLEDEKTDSQKSAIRTK